MHPNLVVVPLLVLAAGVSAGLEDALYSTVVTSKNFDKVMNSQSVGTLTAFFAPWCGHCKSLEPTWTKVAQAFDGDDRCKVAHLNADEAENKPLATKYGVTGFPTLKFIPSGGKEAITYQGGRTEAALLEFLNEQCGTHKLPGGALSDKAGRVDVLDTLASAFFGPTVSRSALFSKASALAASLSTDSSALASYYVKVMSKFLANAEAGEAWVKKEGERLGKMASRKGAIATKKLEEMRMKQNILGSFSFGGEAAIKAAKAIYEEPIAAVVEVVEPVVEKVQEVVEPVVEKIQEAIVEPVVEAVEAVVEPIIEAVEAVVEPVVEAVNEAVVEPVIEIAEEVIEKVEEVVEAPVEEVVEEPTVVEEAAAPVEEAVPVVEEPVHIEEPVVEERVKDEL